MVEDEHKSIPELIHSIEKKDKRFRIAQTIFMMAVMIALALSGYFLVTNSNKDRIAREKQTSEIIQRQSQKIDDLSNKLQCLGNFFAQPDRQNLVVKDLNTCFTERLSDGSSLFLSGPVSNNTNANDNTNSGTPQGNASQNQTAPDQPNNNQVPQINTPPDPTTGERPPKKVLGVPLCIPFTDRCVRD